MITSVVCSLSGLYYSCSLTTLYMLTKHGITALVGSYTMASWSMLDTYTLKYKCPLYGIAECPLSRGFECSEVYGDMVQDL